MIGKTLPSSFFLYDKGTVSPDSMENLALAVANVLAPSTSQVLGYAYSLDNQPTTAYTSAMQQSSASSESQYLSSRNAHRFSSIYGRRRIHSAQEHKRDNSTSSEMPLTPTETAITRGYSDGFLTAKIFAQYNLSKLGFVGQYIQDSVAALGPSIIEPGQETYYMEWFFKGLSDAQNLISVASSNST